MHNINARKKQSRETIIRFISYGVLGVVALLLTILAGAALQGYDYNRRTGEVIQNGLILVNSSPGGADIYIDGQRERVRTPARLALPAGTYDVELQREGYQPWKKTVDVLGSEVTWLFYPNFIPQTISTDIIDDYRDIRIYEPGPDRESFLLNSRADGSTLMRYSLTDVTDEPDVIELPAALIDESVDPEYRFIKWREAASQVLLTIQRSEGLRYIVVDLDNPARSELISSQAINGASSIIFAEADSEFLYIKDKNLFKLNIDTNVTTPLASEVSSILRGPNDLIYITRSLSNRDELHVMDENEEIRFIQSFNAKVSLIEAGEYESQTFLLMRRGTDKVIMLRDPATLENPTTEKVFTVAVDGEVDFSTSDRFIRFSDSDTEVYDLERALSFNLTHDKESIIGWFDNTRMVSTDGNLFSLLDFDGANSFEIADGLAQYLPLSDINADYVFSIGNSSASERLVLQRSNLVAE